MPNLSVVHIVGHLGRDVETKFLPSGDAVAEFSVATTMKRKSGDVTTWWKCSAFGKSAEIAGQYLAKGDAVMVLGTAYNEPWKDKDGADRLTLKVAVDRIVLLGKREAPTPTEADRQDKSPPKREAKSAPMAKTPKGVASNPFEDMDSDLPF